MSLSKMNRNIILSNHNNSLNPINQLMTKEIRTMNKILSHKKCPQKMKICKIL